MIEDSVFYAIDFPEPKIEEGDRFFRFDKSIKIICYYYNNEGEHRVVDAVKSEGDKVLFRLKNGEWLSAGWFLNE